MKKLLVVAVLLLVAAAATPWAIGWRTEQLVRERVAQVDADKAAQVRLRIDSYSRGWRSSDAQISVVDREGQVVFLYGRTGRYLEPAGGHAGAWHVLRLMREALRMPLVTAIRRAASEGSPVHLQGVRFELEGRTESIDISVLPLDHVIALKGLLLVTLKEPRPAPAAPAASRAPHPAARRPQP